ncbi:MAG: GntR family transcriptional regulator [Clostridia bacterium]|nr:GntR family transcriptional regulator [Clostridia bacterium]
MECNIEKSKPICPQIYEFICAEIAAGEKRAGEQLYSVRELALKIGVNPNTVQKAFESLEKDGLIYSVIGTGRFVSENCGKAKEIVQSIAEKKTKFYLSEMQKLGFSAEEIREKFLLKEPTL